MVEGSLKKLSSFRADSGADTTLLCKWDKQKWQPYILTPVFDDLQAKESIQSRFHTFPAAGTTILNPPIPVLTAHNQQMTSQTNLKTE